MIEVVHRLHNHFHHDCSQMCNEDRYECSWHLMDLQTARPLLRGRSDRRSLEEYLRPSLNERVDSQMRVQKLKGVQDLLSSKKSE